MNVVNAMGTLVDIRIELFVMIIRKQTIVVMSA